MMRIVVVAGALLLGIGALAAQQDQVKETQAMMKGNGKNAGALSAIVKGEKPYDQATVNAAIGQFDDTAKKLPTLFPASIKGAEVRGGLQPVTEDLERQGRFRRSHCKLRQNGHRGQGKDQGSGFAESNHARDRQGMQQLP